MKLLHACPPSCKRLRVDDTESDRAQERHRDALKAIGLPASTYYDWRGAFRRGGAPALKPRSTRPRTVQRRRWTDADDQAVLKLRAKHPYMGKARLQAMLARDVNTD